MGKERRTITGGGSCGTVLFFILVAAFFLMGVSSRPLLMPRDEVWFDLSPLPAAVSGGEDEVLGEDERKVPTGSNPLHNR